MASQPIAIHMNTPGGCVLNAWHFFLINSEGKTIKTEMVYRNPDVGLKTVKEWVAMP